MRIMEVNYLLFFQAALYLARAAGELLTAKLNNEYQLQSVTEFAPKSPFLFVQEPYPAMVFVKGLKGGKLSGRSMNI